MEAEILKQTLKGVLPPKSGMIPRLPLDRHKADEEIQTMQVDDSIIAYITDIVQHTRQHPMIQWGSSARAGIALLLCGRILAAIAGRDFVIPDDIKGIAVPVLGHRIRLTPEAQIADVTETNVIEEIIHQVAFPQ